MSPDGRRLFVNQTNPKTGDDVMQVELDGTHRVTLLVHSPFSERNGLVSPDGRWLAYEANDTGQFEINQTAKGDAPLTGRLVRTEQCN